MCMSGEGSLVDLCCTCVCVQPHYDFRGAHGRHICRQLINHEGNNRSIDVAVDRLFLPVCTFTLPPFIHHEVLRIIVSKQEFQNWVNSGHHLMLYKAPPQLHLGDRIQ